MPGIIWAPIALLLVYRDVFSLSRCSHEFSLGLHNSTLLWYHRFHTIAVHPALCKIQKSTMMAPRCELAGVLLVNLTASFVLLRSVVTAVVRFGFRGAEPGSCCQCRCLFRAMPSHTTTHAVCERGRASRKGLGIYRRRSPPHSLVRMIGMHYHNALGIVAFWKALEGRHY
jgi:hypothetical protein